MDWYIRVQPGWGWLVVRMGGQMYNSWYARRKSVEKPEALFVLILRYSKGEMSERDTRRISGGHLDLELLMSPSVTQWCMIFINLDGYPDIPGVEINNLHSSSNPNLDIREARRQSSPGLPSSRRNSLSHPQSILLDRIRQAGLPYLVLIHRCPIRLDVSFGKKRYL